MWPLSSITDSPGDRALEWAQVARARPSELKYQYLLIYETSWHEVLVCVCVSVCVFRNKTNAIKIAACLRCLNISPSRLHPLPRRDCCSATDTTFFSVLGFPKFLTSQAFTLL